jgi:general secretion pathway protein D
MKYRHLILPTLSILIFAAPSLSIAQGAPPTAPAQTAPPQLRKKAMQLQTFQFEGADLDTVMKMYSEWTGKIYLKTDAVKATITLKADRLTIPECIEVVEAILAMNNIVLVPMGEKFIKVVPANTPDIGGQGLQVNIDTEKAYVGHEKLVTQLIQLNHVDIPGVQAAVQHLMHSYGKIQTLERNNSLLITDTESNIKRVRELVEFIDQPTATIEPRIYQIQYATATEIAAKLNEIITAAQADQKSGAPTVVGNPNARTPPGVIRARATRGQQPAAPTQATISRTEAGSTVIIQGTVKVMADERTNIILIFSQEENFEFFDTIIEVLDVEVEPAITFEVINLEYADAEELSGTLNELVGAAQSAKSTTPGSSGSTGARGQQGQQRTPPTAGQRSGGVRQVTPNATATSSAVQNLSKLSEDTKILADKRSNSILLMGQKADIAAIKNVIASLDVMLEQVLIEAAIFEVELNDKLEHGMQWLYEAQSGKKSGGWDAAGLATNALGNVAGGALTYFQNLTGIDSKMAVKLAASDGNIRLLSNPTIMTTDNTEAKLSVGKQRPVVTSTDSTLNSVQQRSNYEYKDIGIQLTVTPRINPQRFVVMEIQQTADQLGSDILIDGNPVPTISNRELEASVAVPDRGTIALGGLVSSDLTDSVSKIPILGDIPLLGRYLFSSVKKEYIQTEVIVLLTPYVLTNEEELLRESERLYDSTDMQPSDWPGTGWSDSALRFRESEPETGHATGRAAEPEPVQDERTEVEDLLRAMGEQ